MDLSGVAVAGHLYGLDMAGRDVVAVAHRGRRRWAAALALPPVLALVSGCGIGDTPPYNCSWYATPIEVTVDIVAGEYTGAGEDGEPATLTLTADGRYTASNVRGVDWLSGTWLRPDPEGTWELEVADQWDLPLRDEPPPAAKVRLDSRGIELHIGGTEDELLLVDRNDPGETCDSMQTLLRHV